MITHIRDFFTRHYLLLFIILTVGFLLRIFEHNELMHFELDQARDAYVIYDSLASDQLPEQGPMARGSELFLGPMFYYFQIWSVKMFGFSVEALTYSDLLFGFLGLVMTYVLVRKLYDENVALSVTALCASSLFLITYSRFAWNPNAMFFWSLLLFYLLLKMRDEMNVILRWTSLFVIALCLCVLIQLHFIAFLTLPLIVIPYFLIYRHDFYIRELVFVAVTFLILCAPLIRYEFTSGGQTMRSLTATVLEKNEKDEDHEFLEKVVRNTQETSSYFFQSLVSSNASSVALKTRTDGGQFIMCDDKCKDRVVFVALFCLFFFVSLVGFILSRSTRDRDAWNLTALWFASTSIFLTLLAYQISPRFYLYLMPVIVILWAQFFSFWHRISGRRGLLFLTLLIVGFNLFAYVKDIRIAQKSLSEPVSDLPRDVALERSDRVTLSALRSASEIISESGGEDYVLIGDNRYARAIRFLLEVEQGDKRAVCYTKRSGLVEEDYESSLVWILVRSKSEDHIPALFGDTHMVVDSHQLGSISLYKLEPLSATIYIDPPEGCYKR